MGKGFVQLNRSQDTLELIKRPNEFALISVIALRARRTNDFNIHNLRIGEALVGDHQNYGLTERQYRTAKTNLETWGKVTFKATNKGTLARLTDTSVYNINIETDDEQTDKQDDSQATNKMTVNRRATDEQDDSQATTNNKDKNYNNSNKGKNLKKEIRDLSPAEVESFAVIFINYWNSISDLPRVGTMTSVRLKHLNARMKEPVFMENWQMVLHKLSRSSFHTGDNDRGWKATMDWIICNDTNYQKMLELGDEPDPLDTVLGTKDADPDKIRELEEAGIL